MSWKGKVRRVATRAGFSIERAPRFESVAGHLKRLLPRYGIDCVLDVGANEGQYASSLRAVGYTGRIVSYEPVSDVYERLAAAAADDPVWNTHRLALSDEPGLADINVYEQSQISSFLDLNGFYVAPGNSRTLRTETVAVERLADRFDEDTVGCRSVYLKIDTQGSDLAVVRGAEPVMDRIAGMQLEASVQAIYEHQTHWVEAVAAVEALGFVPTGMFPVHRDTGLRVIEFDAVFARADPV